MHAVSNINSMNAKTSKALTTFMMECHKTNPSLIFMLIVISYHSHSNSLSLCHVTNELENILWILKEWVSGRNTQSHIHTKNREKDRVCTVQMTGKREKVSRERARNNEINVPLCLATG